MSGATAFKVDLNQAARGKSPLVLPIDDAFFASVGQEEILGGEAVAQVDVREVAEGLFRLTLVVKGTVRVACDRCLESVDLPVEASETVEVRLDDAEVPAGCREDGTRDPEGSADRYDLAWDVYEAVALSLPLRRTHEEGACDPGMLRYLEGGGSGDEK